MKRKTVQLFFAITLNIILTTQLYSQWVGRIGDDYFENSYDITTDANGYVYISGTLNDYPDFDIGSGELIIGSNNGRDAFFAKYNASGTVVWAKNIDGYSTDVDADKIEVDNSGNVYIVGSFFEHADFDPGAGTYNLNTPGTSGSFSGSSGGWSSGLNPYYFNTFFAKYDVNGDFLWAKNFKTY